jgi:hypothetical protein
LAMGWAPHAAVRIKLHKPCEENAGPNLFLHYLMLLGSWLLAKMGETSIKFLCWGPELQIINESPRLCSLYPLAERRV